MSELSVPKEFLANDIGIHNGQPDNSAYRLIKGNDPQGVIYLCTNLINGKVYVGQTWDFTRRLREHKYSPVSDGRFARALHKYEFSNFHWDVLASASTQDNLDKLEIYWIAFFDSCNKNNGYNLRLGAANGQSHPDTCAKISKSLKGRTFSAEHKHKISLRLTGNQNWVGRKHSDETKAKMRQSALGKKRSASHRQHLREANLGKKLSEEHKRKIGESGQGRKHTEETRKRISESHMGIRCSDETKKKISLANKGRKRKPTQ